MTDDTMEEYYGRLRRQFERTPAMRFLAQSLTRLAPGHAEIVVDPRDEYRHGGGCVHGGILAALLDNVGWFACATVSEGSWLSTAEFKVNFLTMAADERLVAKGEVLKAGTEIFHARMDVATEGGRAVATSLGTYMRVPRTFRT